MKKSKKSIQNGYVSLLSVLIIGSVGTSIAVSLLLMGQGRLHAAYSLQIAAQALSVTDGCVEEALLEISQDSNTTGGTSVVIGPHTCSYFIENSSGENKIISASTTISNVVQRVRVTTSSTSPLSIQFWNPVESF